MKSAPLSERLQRNSVPVPWSGCQIWTGHLNRGGYGVVGVRGRSMLAHRAAWLNSGGAIPVGLFVLHRCDVRCCINVDHLFLGTYLDNAADCIAKGRDHKAPWHRNASTKLTPEQVRAIRHDPRGSRRLAPEYGVSAILIRKIRQGIIWKQTWDGEMPPKQRVSRRKSRALAAWDALNARTP